MASAFSGADRANVHSLYCTSSATSHPPLPSVSPPPMLVVHGGHVKNFASPKALRAVSRQYSVTSQTDFVAPPVPAPVPYALKALAHAHDGNGYIQGNKLHVSHSQLETGSALGATSPTTKASFPAPPLPAPSVPAPVISNTGFVSNEHGFAWNRHADTDVIALRGSKLLQRFESSYDHFTSGVDRAAEVNSMFFEQPPPPEFVSMHSQIHQHRVAHPERRHVDRNAMDDDAFEASAFVRSIRRPGPSGNAALGAGVAGVGHTDSNSIAVPLRQLNQHYQQLQVHIANASAASLHATTTQASYPPPRQAVFDKHRSPSSSPPPRSTNVATAKETRQPSPQPSPQASPQASPAFTLPPVVSPSHRSAAAALSPLSPTSHVARESPVRQTQIASPSSPKLQRASGSVSNFRSGYNQPEEVHGVVAKAGADRRDALLPAVSSSPPSMSPSASSPALRASPTSSISLPSLHARRSPSPPVDDIEPEERFTSTSAAAYLNPYTRPPNVARRVAQMPPRTAFTVSGMDDDILATYHAQGPCVDAQVVRRTDQARTTLVDNLRQLVKAHGPRRSNRARQSTQGVQTSQASNGYVSAQRPDDPITTHAIGFDQSSTVGSRAKLHARMYPEEVVDRHRHKLVINT